MGDEKFIELVTKKLTGEINQPEADELKILLDTSPSFKQQYEAMSLYWKNSDTHQQDNKLAFSKLKDKIKKAEEAGLDDHDTDQHLLPPPAAFKKKTYFWAIAAALLVFAAAALTYLLYFADKDQEGVALQQFNSNGQKAIITLNDGTKVTLNSKSVLAYPASFNHQFREVTLTGEAYFDVKKDPKHPFIIHTGKMNIKVLGTAFNVKSYPKDSVMETTLLRGAIEVTLNDRPEDRILLKPNEKLVVKNASYNKPNLPVAPKHDTAKNSNNTQYTLTSFTYQSDSDSTLLETAWLSDQMVFRNESFEDIALQMEQRYGVNVVFKNEGLKKFRFTGYFEKSAPHLLNDLRLTEKFHYQVSNSTIYIY
ncbi:hypothetical protein A0256_20265 [Mucilaginibacter sp. PAMC 26640]|nr:hypothetical protein A0256_20265 [Mucilaginibacter sp. PAMC 26640]